ncbi:sodium:solute symporter family protein [Teredinibacter sp. KSP-S5-2]|uniref:sodium:solute symporter family protein n=1 Tax=Teredinibacter sp. KSP-S5-2 TaxID=3034506 RepID=UPI0029347BB2|nr:sodium:solute symporter family protein [Teredinibacter sp. KSP-S5-2]WNO08502.1 sodium:solute symporter family protein [Teredinibacter sp. KSP-S5-2]
MNTGLFLSAFAFYVFAMIVLSWFVSRNHKSGEDFLLGGRSLPFLLTLGTTVATMVGTGSSMGAVGFGYENGWAGTLYGIGGAVGILLLAVWFAPVREMRFMTMSEELSYYAGADAGVKSLVGILIFVASIGWLGAHILGGGMYLAWLTGIDTSTAKIYVALGFAIYVIIGGYTAVVWTDSIQAIILFVGFLLMAALSIQVVGGWDALMQAQPQENISFLSVDKIGALHALSLSLVIFVGVMATPSFRQRIYSGKNVSTIRKSFITSGVLYLGFSFIPALIGMSAFALNPELDNRNYAFPFLALEVLPAVVGMVVLIAGLSATMSSASSDAIAAVTILMRDVSVTITGSVPEKRHMVLFSRVSLVVVIGLALIFALFSDDIIGYITKMIATVMSGMFVCGLLGRFWGRFNAYGAYAALATGSIVSFSIILNENWNSYWGNPVIPSVLIACTTSILVSLLTPQSRLSPKEAQQKLSDERAAMEEANGELS